jgi:hypothetical protein
MTEGGLKAIKIGIWLLAMLIGYLFKGIPMVGAIAVGWFFVAKFSKKKEPEPEYEYEEYYEEYYEEDKKK